MTDDKGQAKVLPIRGGKPSAEDLAVLGVIKDQRLAREAEEKAKSKKGKKGKVADAKPEPVSFKTPAEALAEVLKAKAAEDRADAARTKIGKEHGQILKDRKASLASAVESIEGKSQLAEEVRALFQSITDNEERAKGARAKVKTTRAKIAEEIEADVDRPDWFKKIARAWRAVEKAKDEAAQARADAKRKLATAGERVASVVEGAKQLVLDL